MSIPAEPLYHKELEENRRAGNPWQVTKVVEDLKKKGQGRGSVESVSAAFRTRRGTHQS